MDGMSNNDDRVGDFVDRIDSVDCVNGVNSAHAVSKVISVIFINKVNIAFSLKFHSQLPAERPVQQRLLQRLQRRELAGVEGDEALGLDS